MYRLKCLGRAYGNRNERERYARSSLACEDYTSVSEVKRGGNGDPVYRALFGIRCPSVCYVPYGDLANHTLLNHRRHPALFARFDEANSRFAFAFAFRSGMRA